MRVDGLSIPPSEIFRSFQIILKILSLISMIVGASPRDRPLAQRLKQQSTAKVKISEGERHAISEFQWVFAFHSMDSCAGHCDPASGGARAVARHRWGAKRKHGKASSGILAQRNLDSRGRHHHVEV